MAIRMEKLGMTRFNLIRENFLADARHYFLASDTMTEPEQRPCTSAHKQPAARVIIKAQARFMDTAI